MRFASQHPWLTFALCLSASALAQGPGDVADATPAEVATQTRVIVDDPRLLLRFGAFDPLQGTPMVPEALRAAADTHLYIVQFGYAFTDRDRAALRDFGAALHGPLPNNAVIVRMDAATATAVAGIAGVRWVGAYEPAYRLESELLTALAAGQPMPLRKYNLLMADKRNQKAALQGRIEAVGGKVTDRHDRGLLMTTELTAAQLLQVARFDEVLWIDRWTPAEEDMNNARTLQGTNHVQSVLGYTGAGVRGHVYEGVEFDHPDFTYAMTNVRSGGGADTHGHCTAGIIFGNGTSHANARGHAPGARGYYTQYTTVTAGWSRNAVIDDVVNVHNCMFTTASWGGGVTTAYTSVSADADDIVFDHRIPWTQSQSNTGNQNSRPEAWAKNVISVGGMYHYNNTNPGDDAWGGGGSIGPAADSRIKPDLCNFYDDVLCSDRTGASGYSSGNYTTDFGGTSAATPLTAGLNAIAIEMYFYHRLPNAIRVPGGTAFENRPYAQTLKALQIACASMYPYGTGTGQSTRYRGGWGYGNVGTMCDNRANMHVVPEDQPIQQGQTHTHLIDVPSGQAQLKVCMTYLEPAGNPASSSACINNLNLRVFQPNGTTYYWGNKGLTASNTSTSGGANLVIVDSVECVIVNNPPAGQWTIEITAPTIAQDAHLATAATDATYALVALGGKRGFSSCARYVPDSDAATGTANYIPFGTQAPSTLTSMFASNNGGSVGGAVYFDITPATNLYLHGLEVNTGVAASTALALDIYTRSGSYAGNEGSMTGWSARTAGHGVAAGQDLPSHVDFNAGIYMASGITYGVAVVARNFGHRYTGSANTYTNADLTWTLGSATNVPFSGSPFSPRSANMTLLYQRDEASWHNQIMQLVLPRSELGGAGNITGLAFAPSTSGRHYNRFLRIRMTHKSAGYALETTFTNNITGATTVLDKADYVWHTTADEWNEIGLTSPFVYNGTSDVVVEIFARGNHQQIGTTGGFRRGTEQRLYAYGWPFAAQPATGTLGDSATKIRANFNCAEAGMFGTACGPIRAVPFSTPVAGSTFWFDIVDALPSSAAVIGMGFNSNSPYPASLTSYGMTNCLQWNDHLATRFVLVPSTGHAWHSMSIPNTTLFDGLTIYGQWFNLDPAQPRGITASNYVRMIIGQENP